jgi:hypothetical protein
LSKLSVFVCIDSDPSFSVHISSSAALCVLSFIVSSTTSIGDGVFGLPHHPELPHHPPELHPHLEIALYSAIYSTSLTTLSEIAGFHHLNSYVYELSAALLGFTGTIKLSL